MALDVPAIGSATQTLKYIKAAWETTRDGGATGLISIPSQQIPVGARILGHAYYVVESFTDLGTSTFSICLSNVPIVEDLDAAQAYGFVQFFNGEAIPVQESSPPISILVDGDGYSAGSMYIYVFYV